MDIYGFYRGESFEAYQYLGAHVEADGVVFRVYAPNAERVALIGEFNDWTEAPMMRIHDGSFWELKDTNAKAGQMYKYRIHRKDGMFIDHADPYGFGMELRPKTASIIRKMDDYTFADDAWMKARTDCRDKPMNIYEVHMGSFKKPEDKPDAWYNYEELIDILIPYLKEYGYNFIETMPLSEHPSDESWGYQNTGFFSPTARYGTAVQLKKFVDACHKNGIGVIMDYVPVHFAVDGYALAQFDGTAIYEYPYADIAYSEWGSCNFMHSRGEVRSFLQSAANYWLQEYHVDGLRMDAISRMIYWQGDENRGVNVAAVDFLKQLNSGLKLRHPSAILAAEDSTSYPGITRPVFAGGLGFDYKWDMGWMNDTLNYIRTDPLYRSYDYHKLTFSMMYFYNENYMLPLSHDETVHGKATILQKMFGQYEDKFPQARLFYMYMYGHPGKKLNFMGNEIGQLREWDEKREQDWFILSYPIHDSFHRFMKDLNHLYLDHSCFSSKDYSYDGFQWLDCHQENRCLYAFKRSDEKEEILCAFNFSGIEQDNFYLDLGSNVKDLKVLLASDRDIYNGNRVYEDPTVLPVTDGKISLNLPAFAAIFYQMEKYTEKELAEMELAKKKTTEKNAKK